MHVVPSRGCGISYMIACVVLNLRAVDEKHGDGRCRGLDTDAVGKKQYEEEGVVSQVLEGTPVGPKLRKDG